MSPSPADVRRALAPVRRSHVVLVPRRCGISLLAHPDLVPLLASGWRIRQASPRLVEGRGACLLVVLTREQPLHAPRPADLPSRDDCVPLA